jgi:hypothetical protein
MRTSTVFWGGILILVGAFILLNNLGIFRVNILQIFWPLLLILLGIWVLSGALLPRGIQVEQVNVPLDGASRAHLRVNHGAGRLRISASKTPETLLEGEFGGGLDISTRKSGESLVATMRSPTQNWFNPFWWGPGISLDWTFNLVKDLPLKLEFDTGASDSRIDLSELLVTELNVKSGASSTEITLPASAGFTNARVGTVAASLRINVPPGVALKMRTVTGLGSVRVDRHRFPRREGYYQSDGFETAENKVELHIEIGVGSVDVR